ncbi:MAG: serine--tRNA ligase [Planctomycetota bacterium]
MIDLKLLREDPDRFRKGAQLKGATVDIDRVLELDTARRELLTEQERLRADQKKLEKEMGPEMGRLSGQMKKAEGAERDALKAQIAALREKPAGLKARIQELDDKLQARTPELNALLLAIPQPPDPDVPVGDDSSGNVEIRRWDGPTLAGGKSFESQRGFAPKTHLELLESLDLADFERGVKLAGTRSYVLKGLGFRLHQAILRYAFDFMVDRHGFHPRSVPSLVREETMVGTGFFPGGRDQSYHVEETARGGGYDLFLAGTGEVGLMGLHMDEILDASSFPLRYVTVSPCYRREAGAAGRDTAGLYRIHQFEKVEQVVICLADEAESRAWHGKMISFVEDLLQSLELPYRLLQCCTGDLGQKNADMIDLECWMPGRGDEGKDGRPVGDWGETHSASRLYDFQCRRLNLRYRDPETGKPVFAHSLNNTVAASPRVLIPLLEVHQQADGTVRIPEALRPHMGGLEQIG